MYWNFFICRVLTYEMHKINFNMGCIETLLILLHSTAPWLINFNMGCIETWAENDGTACNIMINFNMGCIETIYAVL